MIDEEELRTLAREIRRDILEMIYQAKSGHPGGSLSAVEILAALYFTDHFRCDPTNANWAERDRFLLSKGHGAPVLYSVLARRGFFPREKLSTLRQLDSILQGHPNAHKTPGLDCSSGSLGQGLSIANGLAYAWKHRDATSRVYCLLGDGELQEGQIWEAAMFAPQHGLDNVCAIVDYNGIQLDGPVAEIKGVAPLKDKWVAFGWNVIEVDGHNIADLYAAYTAAKNCKGKPSVILAKTVKGKGVSYMENEAKWHGNVPNEAQYQQALVELEVVL